MLSDITADEKTITLLVMLSLTKPMLYFLNELLPEPFSMANLEYRNYKQLQPLPRNVLLQEINTPVVINSLNLVF